MFKEYGCGCIGIPYHSTQDYKEESAMCVVVCEGSDELEQGSVCFTDRTFTDEGERLQLKKARTLTKEESEVLCGRIRKQLWDGDHMNTIRRWMQG